MADCGILYLVATPIGNLADITLRAIETLREADFIACEDTRKSGILLKHLQIRKPLVSCHEFNERQISERIVSRILAGENAALISDAGSPAISDPGFPLVRLAVAEGIEVVPIPGATALIAAVSASGLPTDAFIFYGFLPPKAGKRQTILESLKERRETLIFYESPYKIGKLLEQVEQVLGNRHAALCRELTKKFEEIIRGDIQLLRQRCSERTLKGEITLVVEGVVRKRRD